jgi:hypothetical protein
MKTTRIKQLTFKVLFLNLSFIYGINVLAQTGVTVYTDMGSNNVSNGLFVKTATIGSYKFGKNTFETGFQADLKNSNLHGFSGYTVDFARDLVLRRSALGLHGFYTTTLSSAIMRESNIGAYLNMRFDHFEMIFGTNFRTFTLRPGSITDYQIYKNTTKIHEVNNLMYSFTYNLKPEKNRWNAGLSLTNIDHFNINQETNPMFNLHGSYKIKLPVRFYAQAWYKIAGASNLKLNYFGFYIRTGIIWNFN